MTIWASLLILLGLFAGGAAWSVADTFHAGRRRATRRRPATRRAAYAGRHREVAGWWG